MQGFAGAVAEDALAKVSTILVMFAVPVGLVQANAVGLAYILMDVL